MGVEKGLKMLNFKELYKTDYHFGDLFVMHQYWKNRYVYTKSTPRKTSALLYFGGCSGVYREQGRAPFAAPRGALVYIPQGSLYQTEFVDCEAGQIITTLIEFTLLDETGAPFAAADRVTVLDETPSLITVNLIREMANDYLSPVICPAALRSNLYRLLLEYSQEQHQSHIFSKEFSCIAPGILYLEKDMTFEKNIEEIAALCHVSVSCFRRLFKKYAGVPPLAFQTRSRIEYAKKLLLLDTMSVGEIAAALHYSDVAYFCRAFKKLTGYTPSEYAKKS